MRDLRQVGQQLGPGALVMRVGVGRVAVLVEHHPVGVLGGQLLGVRDRRVRPALGGREDDPRAVELEQLAALDRGVLRHHADHRIALEQGRHRQRDAGVATGRFENGGAGLQDSALFGVLDHPQRGPVLDGARRVAVLELGPQPHVRRPVLAVIPAGRQPAQARPAACCRTPPAASRTASKSNRLPRRAGW